MIHVQNVFERQANLLIISNIDADRGAERQNDLDLDQVVRVE